MKKGTFLFCVTAMLAVFTACGSGENHEESAKQAEYRVTEEVAQTVQENADGSGASAESGNPGSDAAWSAYEYEPDIIRYGELSGTFSFRKDVEKTRTDYAVYYFETSIGEQERQACIAATDRMLSHVGGTLNEIEIVVLKPESYDGILVSGNRLYTPIQPWESLDYFAKVLLAGYGEWGNYGLAYGYANYLCKEAGFNNGEAGPVYRDADRFLPMSSPELYDLNLLCFDERFASLEDIEAAKNNACLFVDEYLSTHSEADFHTLLSDSGSVEGVSKANEALKAFYTENGMNCSLTEIRYRYGGVAFDYMAACEYACFYLDKDWKDVNWETNPMVSENFLHEDYIEVKAFFECNVRQMRQYQELFGFNSYYNDLSVFFSNDTSILDISFYQMGNHRIYLKSVVSLMHEYIHSLMDGRDDRDNLWTYEGFARNYDCLYNEYAYDYWNYDYNHSTEIYGPHEAVEYFEVYLEHIGRPFNIKTDYRDLGDFLTRAYGWNDPNLSYQSGASFVAYLVDCYGEQAVIRYIGADKEYNAEWGKSYEELVRDWLDYINENYSWYGTE